MDTQTGNFEYTAAADDKDPNTLKNRALVKALEMQDFIISQLRAEYGWRKKNHELSSVCAEIIRIANLITFETNMFEGKTETDKEINAFGKIVAVAKSYREELLFQKKLHEEIGEGPFTSE